MYVAALSLYVYTLSLLVALPISVNKHRSFIVFYTVDYLEYFVYFFRSSYDVFRRTLCLGLCGLNAISIWCFRSEEHTSELQSRENLVCRLLLEKKNSKKTTRH